MFSACLIHVGPPLSYLNEMITQDAVQKLIHIQFISVSGDDVEIRYPTHIILSVMIKVFRGVHKQYGDDMMISAMKPTPVAIVSIVMRVNFLTTCEGELLKISNRFWRSQTITVE